MTHRRHVRVLGSHSQPLHPGPPPYIRPEPQSRGRWGARILPSSHRLHHFSWILCVYTLILQYRSQKMWRRCLTVNPLDRRPRSWSTIYPEARSILSEPAPTRKQVATRDLFSDHPACPPRARHRHMVHNPTHSRVPALARGHHLDPW